MLFIYLLLFLDSPRESGNLPVKGVSSSQKSCIHAMLLFKAGPWYYRYNNSEMMVLVSAGEPCRYFIEIDYLDLVLW